MAAESRCSWKSIDSPNSEESRESLYPSGQWRPSSGPLNPHKPFTAIKEDNCLYAPCRCFLHPPRDV